MFAGQFVSGDRCALEQQTVNFLIGFMKAFAGKILYFKQDFIELFVGQPFPAIGGGVYFFDGFFSNFSITPGGTRFLIC